MRENIVKYGEREGEGGVSWVDCPLTQIQTCGHLLRPLTHHYMPDFFPLYKYNVSHAIPG